MRRNGTRFYDSPNQLAKGVEKLWTTFVVGEYVHPPLPSHLQLRSLLEVAYLAGMETDEGRPSRFLICCTQISESVLRQSTRPIVESLSFKSDRPFGIQELSRLAASVDVDASAIWVRFGEDTKEPLMIHGLMNLGSSWVNARNAYAYHYDPLPEALLVRVDGPGDLKVYQGRYLIAAMKSGSIRLGGTISTLDLLGIHRLIREGHDLLRKRIKAPKHEEVKEWYEFEWLSYVNVVLAVVNTIQLAGHGGALIYAGVNSNVCRDGYVKAKYGLSDGNNYLQRHFIDFMNLRHKFGDGLWLSENRRKTRPSKQALRLADYEVKEAQSRLAETCSFVGKLAGTDGAIILRNDLTVEGYGAEIILDKAQPSKVYEVKDPARKLKKQFDSERFGMRHRSAMRLCGAASDLAVFVVSQDGGVSLVWNDEGKVCFKAGVQTTNQNMIFA
jgi:hypothetical protein